MNSTISYAMLDETLSFPLRRTFPTEIGWTSAVRRRAHDPLAHEFLGRRYARLFGVTSPAAILASWEPLAGEMLYYMRQSPAGKLSFFSTDRFFAHEIDLTANRQTPELAAVRELLAESARAWTRVHPGTSCPIAPTQAGYPGALLRHVLVSECVSVIVAPSIPRAKRLEACA